MIEGLVFFGLLTTGEFVGLAILLGLGKQFHLPSYAVGVIAATLAACITRLAFR